MIPYDIYVLSPNRSKVTVELFLSRFGKGMEASAADYPVPQFADNPIQVFTVPGELVDYLIQHPAEPYNLYYRNLGQKESIRNAIVSFTNDGNMIVGLTVKVPDPNGTVLTP